MKKIIISTLLLASSMAFSQVVIGDAVGTAAANKKTAVLLEFAAGQNKGIILPYVRTMPSGVNLTEGTILVDATDATKAKVKYYNGSWQDLSSGNEANLNQFSVSGGATQNVMTAQPSTVTEVADSKAVIGANSSAAKGVLVLESTTKAMVLPIVAKTDDVPDPAPGMMVYVNKTGAKRLAVFNGSKWTYWAPN
ncbi:MAG: hypothetical protein JST62_03635 [Bacteroidetes bacterium]|nr:hypothetical protein [Bacteroidota bacterium]